MWLKKVLVYLGLLLSPHLSLAENVHEYHLKNGLKLLVKEDHRAPVVISEIWYKVGGSYEPNGITGISHALEHMMFRGTQKYGPNRLEQIVAANGGQQNAFTDNDFTAYYQEFSVDKLSISFNLEADRMRNLLLRQGDFAKEIQVVMEERRMRVDDNPQATLLERFNAAAFVESPYHHPVIGWKNDLKNMTVTDVRAWYKNWYAPNNAIVVVVGDVKPNEVYQLARKYFDPIQPIPLPAIKPTGNIQPLGQHRLTLHIPAQLTWLVMAYPVPVIKTDFKSSDPYVLDLIATLLSSGNSGQLAKNLIRGKQIAAEADASYNPFSRLNNLFILDAIPTPGHTLTELETSLLKQIKLLQTHIVSTEELKRAKAQIAANKIYQEDSITQQAYELGSLAAVDLPWQLEKDYLKHINAVTPKQIQNVANKYLQSQYLTIAHLHPLSWQSSHTTTQGPLHVR
ncbi:MAG: pitrilysin family protein [Rickettsiella sp.]|nr:pitrilysin family protein [Rickettsiella sp.]